MHDRIAHQPNRSLSRKLSLFLSHTHNFEWYVDEGSQGGNGFKNGCVYTEHYFGELLALATRPILHAFVKHWNACKRDSQANGGCPPQSVNCFCPP